MKKPKIFISYCHEDHALKSQLDRHLNSLKISNIVDVWYDGLIQPGDEWEKAIDDQLNEADIVLLLISVNFINSKYCYSVELKKAMERHENGTTRVVPIILSHCYWENQPFAKFQALPSKARPISSFPDRDEAYFNIVNELHSSIKSINIPLRVTSNVEVPKIEHKRETDFIMPWREYYNQVNKIADFFSLCEYKPDFVFGITNGGLIAADLISRISFQNIPLFSLWADRLQMPTNYYSDPFNSPLLNAIKSNEKKIEILIIDDNISSGQTFVQTALFLKESVDKCHISYVPLFTKNKHFMNIKYMKQCLIWNHPTIRPILAPDFDPLIMHYTNYYEFPYGKGIKTIS